MESKKERLLPFLFPEIAKAEGNDLLTQSARVVVGVMIDGADTTKAQTDTQSLTETGTRISSMHPHEIAVPFAP